MHTGATVESFGKPSVNLVTEAFRSLGKATAKGKRVPELPIIVLPLGYDGWPEEEIRRDIRNRLPDVMNALVQPQKKGK